MRVLHYGDDAGTWYVGEETYRLPMTHGMAIKSTSRLRGDNPVRPDPAHDRSVFTVLFVNMRIKIASTCD